MPTDVDSTVLTNNEVMILQDIQKLVEELLDLSRRVGKSQPDTLFITRCNRMIEIFNILRDDSKPDIRAWRNDVRDNQ